MRIATSADGVPISYETLGVGNPALVFVHGWSCDRSYWKAQLEHFGQRHQVVGLDLAGHGESGGERRDWTMSAFGEDVRAVIEALRLNDIVLIGHSMGGDVIVEAARRMTKRLRGLVWVDVYYSLGKSLTESQVNEFLAPFHDNFVKTTNDFVRKMFVASSDKALVDWIAKDMSAAPPTMALKVMRQAITFDLEIPACLKALKAPIVAINSDRRPTDVEGLQRYGVKVLIMPSVGHFMMMESPVDFNRLLAETIAKF